MTPSSLAQFGTSFASGTLRIDDADPLPWVGGYVRDNEPHCSRRGRLVDRWVD
jgi:hypothetical protein